MGPRAIGKGHIESRNGMVRGVLGCGEEAVKRGIKMNCVMFTLNVISVFTLGKMKREGNVACMPGMETACSVIVRKPEINGLLERP